MNLPADPQERRRITAAVLQQRFGRNINGFQPYHSVIDENEHQDDNDACDDQYYLYQQKQQVSACQGRYANANGVVCYQPLRPQSFVASRQVIGGFNNHHKHHIQQQQQQYQIINNRRIVRSKIEKFPHPSSTRGGGAGGGAAADRGANTKLLNVHLRTKIAPLCSGESDNDLKDDVRKRLSLPNDTSIPDSFFNKLNTSKLIDDNTERPLSRIDRRESLLDIGFGKLATYKKLHILGSGTYSIVYKGTSRLTNKFVALKEIHLEREEGVPFTAIREISLLKQLKHNNVITLHDIIYTNRILILVFEYVDRDLGRYMDECDHKICLENVKLFLFQLLRALKYCHDRRVLHRDIKPQNILISKTGELKLADFGLARAKSFPTKTYTDEVVTLWYRPPDVLLGNVDYGTSIDMWGVGCIFFEMVAGFTLFLGVDPKKQIGSIFEIIGTPDEADWPTIKSDLRLNSIDIPFYTGRDLASVTPRLDEIGIDLLRRFLKCNPKLRITSNEAIHHKYFKSFPPEIYNLHDSLSIFSIPSVRLMNELTRNSLSSSLQNVNV